MNVIVDTSIWSDVLRRRKRGSARSKFIFHAWAFIETGTRESTVHRGLDHARHFLNPINRDWKSILSSQFRPLA